MSAIKLSFDVAGFAVAAQAVKSVPERRNTVPIVAHALLQSDGENGAKLTMTDLDMSVTVKLSMISKQPVDIILPPTALDFFIRRKEGEGTIEVAEDGNSITCRQARARLRLPILAAKDYPQLVMVEDAPNFAILGHEFAKALSSVKCAISSEETRYYLNGVLLEPAEGMLKMISTNGHQLHHNQFALPPGAENITPPIVPTKAVNHIISLFAESAEELSISISDAIMIVVSETVTLRTKLVDGTFPDWRRVLVEKLDTCFSLPGKQLTAALDTILLIPQGETDSGVKRATAKIGRGVRVECEGDQVVLSLSSRDGSDGTDMVYATVSKTPPPAFGVSAKYLKETIQAICDNTGNPNVTVRTGKGSHALRVASSDEEDNLFAIIMQIRI